MQKRLIRLLQGRFLWYVTAPFAALIAFGIVAELPIDDRFIYPLRELYAELASIAYAPAVILTLLTLATILPLLISWAISQMEGVVGENLPNMRAFVVLTTTVFLAYAQFGDASRPRDTLDALDTGDYRYLLVRQDSLADTDQFFLYECDRGQVLCRLVHVQYGAINGWSRAATLATIPGGVRIENEDVTLHEHAPQ